MEANTTNSANFTPINVADYQTPTSPPPTKNRKINFVNLALLLLTCTSLLGFAYAVRTSQTAVNTNAAYNKNADMEMKMMGMEIGDYKFPKSYRGETIPSTFYTSAKSTSEGEAYVNDYVKDQVIRYYVYKDVLEDNNIESSISADVTDFTSLKEAVSAMEIEVRHNLITSYDFGYIIAHYSSDSPESKQKANTLINSYKTKLESSTSLQDTIEEANNDTELTALNVSDKSVYLKNFDGTESLFPAHSEFNKYLISQTENKVSEPYVLKDQNDVEVGYVIAKIEKITNKKYLTLDQIIKEQQQNFTY